jgi:hypothetical protein
MVSATIVWLGGQMTPVDAAAPVQSRPYPLLELLPLELLLPEVLLELVLPDIVSATTTREPSEARATSALAPRTAYTSFDIDLSLRFCPLQTPARFKFEAAPFATIRHIWVKMTHWRVTRNVTTFTSGVHVVRHNTLANGYGVRERGL